MGLTISEKKMLSFQRENLKKKILFLHAFIILTFIISQSVAILSHVNQGQADSQNLALTMKTEEKCFSCKDRRYMELLFPLPVFVLSTSKHFQPEIIPSAFPRW